MRQITAEAIIKKIESNYIRVQRLCREVPAIALVEPALRNGWSVKDMIGNIAAWVWHFTVILDAARETNNPLQAQPDQAGLNQAFYEERRTWHWVVIEADFRHAHGALFGLIREFPAGRLADPVVQEAIARETWERYARYLPELERWHQCYRAQKLQISELSALQA